VAAVSTEPVDLKISWWWYCQKCLCSSYY